MKKFSERASLSITLDESRDGSGRSKNLPESPFASAKACGRARKKDKIDTETLRIAMSEMDMDSVLNCRDAIHRPRELS